MVIFEPCEDDGPPEEIVYLGPEWADFRPPPPKPAPFRWRWGAFAALLVASVLSSILMIPFSMSLLKQMDRPGLTGDMLPIVLAIGAVIEGVISAAAIALGLWLGPGIAMGIAGFRRGDDSEGGGGGVASTVALSTLLGLLAGVMVLGLAWSLRSGEPPTKEIVMPPIWEGFLASIGAGIREEVWLRFGCMTLIAWVGAQVQRSGMPASMRHDPPAAAVVWFANCVAAFFFALMHVPQASGLIGLNLGVLILVFVGNGLPGLMLGWLYWRRGLAAAMIAHFWWDIVLKVVVPMLGME